jgi:RHS repeat-associated protein
VGGSFARTGMPASLTNASYNADNQLTQFGPSSLTYDANGNLTSDAPFASRTGLRDGTNTYTWSARNQLIAISGGVSANFQYDAFGRRVSKTVAGTTQYLYDGVNPVQELSGASVSANLLTGLGVDGYFQRTDANGTANFLTDALGSTVALTGASGNTLASYTYEPFGNTSVSGSSSNPYQFTSRENDSTGLYFFRARYYSPALQRFIGEDRLVSHVSQNLYAYAENDPAVLGDPLGLSTVHINIVRTYQNNVAITDTLTVSVDGGPIQFQGYSLEPSGELPGSSQPIEVGMYTASVYQSPRLGYPDLLLQVPGRTGIEIHIGDYPRNTEGCILPGTTMGQNSNFNTSVGHSTQAFNSIMNIVSATQQTDESNGEQTTIVVNIGQLVAGDGGP